MFVLCWFLFSHFVLCLFHFSHFVLCLFRFSHFVCVCFISLILFVFIYLFFPFCYVVVPKPPSLSKMAALPGATVLDGPARGDSGAKPGLPQGAKGRKLVARFHYVRIPAITWSCSATGEKKTFNTIFKHFVPKKRASSCNGVKTDANGNTMLQKFYFVCVRFFVCVIGLHFRSRQCRRTASLIVSLSVCAHNMCTLCKNAGHMGKQYRVRIIVFFFSFFIFSSFFFLSLLYETVAGRRDSLLVPVFFLPRSLLILLFFGIYCVSFLVDRLVTNV